MPNLNIGSIYLSVHDHDWFIVMSRLGSQNSIRGNLSSVTGYYVRRRKHEYLEILNYTAAKYSLSPQETFQRLLKNKPLDTPLDEPIELHPIPDLSDEVPLGVSVEVPTNLYEVLVVQAEQRGVSVSDLIQERFRI